MEVWAKPLRALVASAVLISLPLAAYAQEDSFASDSSASFEAPQQRSSAWSAVTGMVDSVVSSVSNSVSSSVSSVAGRFSRDSSTETVQSNPATASSSESLIAVLSSPSASQDLQADTEASRSGGWNLRATADDDRYSNETSASGFSSYVGSVNTAGSSVETPHINTASSLSARTVDEMLASADPIQPVAYLNLPSGSLGNSRGVDVGASYVWESPRYGQFIVSTRTSYLNEPSRLEGLYDSGLLSASDYASLTAAPELQGSLMLTWQIGNHSATAVTHYAPDYIEDIGAMDLEKLDELVGHMATLDLRYGYNIKTGRQGNTMISVGVRNLFDRRPVSQWVDRSNQPVDANGRIAYGTIKYQF